MVPLSDMWCSLMPKGIVGVTIVGCVAVMSRAARWATSVTSRESTWVGRCGPCCSVEPIGTMTMASCLATCASSGALRRAHSISCMLFSHAHNPPISPLQTSRQSAKLPLLVRPKSPVRSGATLERRQRRHRRGKPFPVQLVELAVHGVEEDEAVEPLQKHQFSHSHPHV